VNKFTYLPEDNRKFEKGRNYIGASAMPTLFGLNKKYGQTPMTFWQEFTGRKEKFRGNDRTRAGHWQEDGILARYVKDYTHLNYRGFWISRLAGEDVFENLHSFTEARHPDYEYAVAHADLLKIPELIDPSIIQAKNSGFFAAIREDDKNNGYDPDDHSQNGIPLGIYLQEQWELFCYGVSEAWVAVQIDGWNWQIYGPITYKKKSVENCLALADRMWWHIKNDTPPKPATWPDVVSMYPELREKTAAVIGGKDYEDMITMRQELKDINITMRQLESRAEDIKNATGLLIGGNEILRSLSGEELAKASLRPGREILKLKELKKEKPRTYSNLKKLGFITESEPWRALNIFGSDGSYGKCKQCGKPAGEKKIIKKDGRKISYGPFCPSCWANIIGGDNVTN